MRDAMLLCHLLGHEEYQDILSAPASGLNIARIVRRLSRGADFVGTNWLFPFELMRVWLGSWKLRLHSKFVSTLVRETLFAIYCCVCSFLNSNIITLGCNFGCVRWLYCP